MTTTKTKPVEAQAVEPIKAERWKNMVISREGVHYGNLVHNSVEECVEALKEAEIEASRNLPNLTRFTRIEPPVVWQWVEAKFQIPWFGQ